MMENFSETVNIPDSVRAILNKEPGRKYMNELIEAKKVPVTWNSTKSHVTVYAFDDDTVREAVTLFEKSFVESLIQIDRNSVAATKSDEWVKFTEVLVQEYSLIEFVIRVDSCDLLVACLEAVADIVVAEINTFLKEHDAVEESVDMTDQEHEILKKIAVDQIRTLTTRVATQAGTLDQVTNSGRQIFHIKGSRSVVDHAKNELTKLKTGIKSCSHEVDKPGAEKYLEGSNVLQTLEGQYKALIKVDKDTCPTGLALRSVTEINGIQLKLFEGDITVCQVNALIIPASPDLNMTSTLAEKISALGINFILYIYIRFIL